MLQKARAEKVAKEEAVIKLPAVLGVHQMMLERQKASMGLYGAASRAGPYDNDGGVDYQHLANMLADQMHNHQSQLLSAQAEAEERSLLWCC